MDYTKEIPCAVSQEDVNKTIRVASESRLHLASFLTLVPFPGTDLYRYVEEHMPQNLRQISYVDIEYWGVQHNLTNIPDQKFAAYQRKAWRTFYLRPGRLCRIAMDYPVPLLLPTYLPMLLKRIFKGAFTAAPQLSDPTTDPPPLRSWTKGPSPK